ncbi:MAG: hypothetical protein LBS83_02275 [Holosporales bacterium]|jgi:hypothetical protein|nr:hypothetical protein [Holosporales bacterium]
MKNKNLIDKKKYFGFKWFFLISSFVFINYCISDNARAARITDQTDIAQCMTRVGNALRWLNQITIQTVQRTSNRILNWDRTLLQHFREYHVQLTDATFLALHNEFPKAIRLENKTRLILADQTPGGITDAILQIRDIALAQLGRHGANVEFYNVHGALRIIIWFDNDGMTAAQFQDDTGQRMVGLELYIEGFDTAGTRGTVATFVPVFVGRTRHLILHYPSIYAEERKEKELFMEEQRRQIEAESKKIAKEAKDSRLTCLFLNLLHKSKGQEVEFLPYQYTLEKFVEMLQEVTNDELSEFLEWLKRKNNSVLRLKEDEYNDLLRFVQYLYRRRVDIDRQLEKQLAGELELEIEEQYYDFIKRVIGLFPEEDEDAVVEVINKLFKKIREHIKKMAPKEALQWLTESIEKINKNLKERIDTQLKKLRGERKKTESKGVRRDVTGSQEVHAGVPGFQIGDRELENGDLVNQLVGTQGNEEAADLDGLTNMLTTYIGQTPENIQVLARFLFDTLNENRGVLQQTIDFLKANPNLAPTVLRMLQMFYNYCSGKKQHKKILRFVQHNYAQIIQETINILRFHIQNNSNEELRRQLNVLINFAMTLVRRGRLDHRLLLNTLLDNIAMGGWCAPGYRNRLYSVLASL